VLPIGGICLVGILGRRGLGKIACGVDEPIKGAGSRDMGGQNDGIAFFLISLVELSIIKLPTMC
jgi:hypothetical protein